MSQAEQLAQILENMSDVERQQIIQIHDSLDPETQASFINDLTGTVSGQEVEAEGIAPPQRQPMDYFFPGFTGGISAIGSGYKKASDYFEEHTKDRDAIDRYNKIPVTNPMDMAMRAGMDLQSTDIPKQSASETAGYKPPIPLNLMELGVSGGLGTSPGDIVEGAEDARAEPLNYIPFGLAGAGSGIKQTGRALVRSGKSAAKKGVKKALGLTKQMLQPGAREVEREIAAEVTPQMVEQTMKVTKAVNNPNELVSLLNRAKDDAIATRNGLLANSKDKIAGFTDDAQRYINKAKEDALDSPENIQRMQDVLDRQKAHWLRSDQSMVKAEALKEGWGGEAINVIKRRDKSLSKVKANSPEEEIYDVLHYHAMTAIEKKLPAVGAENKVIGGLSQSIKRASNLANTASNEIPGRGIDTAKEILIDAASIGAASHTGGASLAGLSRGAIAKLLIKMKPGTKPPVSKFVPRLSKEIEKQKLRGAGRQKLGKGMQEFVQPTKPAPIAGLLEEYKPPKPTIRAGDETTKLLPETTGKTNLDILAEPATPFGKGFFDKPRYLKHEQQQLSLPKAQGFTTDPITPAPKELGSSTLKDAFMEQRLKQRLGELGIELPGQAPGLRSSTTLSDDASIIDKLLQLHRHKTGGSPLRPGEIV